MRFHRGVRLLLALTAPLWASTGCSADGEPAPVGSYHPAQPVELVETAEADGPVVVAGGALWWNTTTTSSVTGRGLDTLKAITRVQTRAEKKALPRSVLRDPARALLGAFGSLWTTDGTYLRRYDPRRALADPDGAPRAEIELTGTPPDPAFVFEIPLVEAFGSVWVMAPTEPDAGARDRGTAGDRRGSRLLRVDPGENRVTGEFPVGDMSFGTGEVAVGHDRLYVPTSDGIAALDPRTLEVTARTDSAALEGTVGGLGHMALLRGSLLVQTSGYELPHTVARFDATTLDLVDNATQPLPGTSETLTNPMLGRRHEVWTPSGTGVIRLRTQGGGTPTTNSLRADDLVAQETLPWICDDPPAIERLSPGGGIVWGTGLTEGIWAVRPDRLPVTSVPGPASTEIRYCPEDPDESGDG
ncbi:hypothetical protein AB0F77_39235 [Streptomyces sp. NPDC026672]|uniref:YncE family protein n=1 Tax=unclassified Streptomyces TaxID=2593676 RepID=UPI0033CC97AC